MSIKTRLSLFAVLLLTLILVGHSLIVYFQSRDTVEQIVFAAAIMEAKQNAEIIETWIRGKGEKLSLLAKTTVIRNMNWMEQLPILQQVVAEEEEIESIFIADLTGRARSSSGEVIDISDREYFQEALKTGRTTYSQPVQSRFTGSITVVVAEPIMHSGQVVGVLGATLRLDYLQALVQRMQISNYGYGWIIDANGNTVAHPDARYLGNQDVFIGNPELRSLAEGMKQGQTGIGFYHLDGVSKGLAYAPVPIVGWSIAMTAETKDIVAPAIKLRNESIIATAVAVVVGIIAGYGAASIIAKPIIKFRDIIRTIAEGDLTVEIGFVGKDEIGQLGDALREMTANWRMLIGTINDATSQLNTAAQQLNANCEETAAGAQETSASMNQIAGTVQHVVSELQSLSQGSKEAARHAAEGSEGVVQAMGHMDNIAEASQRLSESFQTLHEKTQEISKVLALITSFADQTNLVSLNATIEAARAGSAGLGFAVVADEVRKMAEQSAQATANIQQLIDSIQRESTDVVKLMQISQEVVGEGSNVIQAVGKRFLEIDKLVQNLNKQFEGIVSSSRQMALSLEQVSATSEEQTAGTEEVAAAADELTQLSNNLSELIRKFKV